MIATTAINRALIFARFLIGLAVILGGSLVWAAPSGSPWGANYFPNVELVTQDGKKVHFYDDLIKDKVFAINFIYTRCTDSCPLETAALRKVQKSLGDRMGRNMFFYSISIDGDRDNPEALKEYAERFKVGPSWIFLTGRPEDVTLLRQKLGMYRSDGEAEKALNEHNINILMGNESAGQWIKRSPYEETDALVRILGMRLQTGRMAMTSVHAGAGQESYKSAPNLPKASRSEDLFRSRCAACHSLGKEEGLGPGLLGVTQKRDRAWLARWLKAPDKLLAEKDAIATDLYNRYKKILMPNLRLSDTDIEALIAYMEAIQQESLKNSN